MAQLSAIYNSNLQSTVLILCTTYCTILHSVQNNFVKPLSDKVSNRLCEVK